MKKIHVLPTDKPSRLYYWKGNDTYNSQFRLRQIAGFCDFNQNNTVNQNIYITNSEEIKEGDWFISLNDDESFMDVIKNTEENFSDFADEEWTYDCKKIILTTDQDLIKDGVQAIDNDFLEWFVKNPSCESVEIERDSREVGGHNGGVAIEYGLYEIIIPKEEPKQETLEEAAEEYVIDESFLSGYKEECERAFINGAKWMQERMYSEEDMIEFGEWCENLQKDNKDIRRNNPDITRKELLELWKKEFKKQ